MRELLDLLQTCCSEFLCTWSGPVGRVMTESWPIIGLLLVLVGHSPPATPPPAWWWDVHEHWPMSTALLRCESCDVSYVYFKVILQFEFCTKFCSWFCSKTANRLYQYRLIHASNDYNSLTFIARRVMTSHRELWPSQWHWFGLRSWFIDKHHIRFVFLPCPKWSLFNQSWGCNSYFFSSVPPKSTLPHRCQNVPATQVHRLGYLKVSATVFPEQLVGKSSHSQPRVPVLNTDLISSAVVPINIMASSTSPQRAPQHVKRI